MTMKVTFPSASTRLVAADAFAPATSAMTIITMTITRSRGGSG